MHKAVSSSELEYESVFSPADVKSVLHKKRSDGKKAPLQRLTTMQRVYVSRLILKHGDNYEVSSHISNQSMLSVNLCCSRILFCLASVTFVLES